MFVLTLPVIITGDRGSPQYLGISHGPVHPVKRLPHIIAGDCCRFDRRILHQRIDLPHQVRIESNHSRIVKIYIIEWNRASAEKVDARFPN